MKAWRIAAILLALAAPAWAQQASDQSQAALKAYQARDFQTAARLWYSQASTGDAIAQYNLGRLYAQGEGVPRDMAEAYKWFALSRAAGRSEGNVALNKIARTMTAAQIAEGQRRAELWRRAHRP